MSSFPRKCTHFSAVVLLFMWLVTRGDCHYQQSKSVQRIMILISGGRLPTCGTHPAFLSIIQTQRDPGRVGLTKINHSQLHLMDCFHSSPYSFLKHRSRHRWELVSLTRVGILQTRQLTTNPVFVLRLRMIIRYPDSEWVGLECLEIATSVSTSSYRYIIESWKEC